MTAKTFTERRELAHRASDGTEVTLFWSTPPNRVTIAVVDSRFSETLEFEVDGSAALDAFNHPYAYANSRPARNAAATRVSANGLPVGTDR